MLLLQTNACVPNKMPCRLCKGLPILPRCGDITYHTVKRVLVAIDDSGPATAALHSERLPPFPPFLSSDPGHSETGLNELGRLWEIHATRSGERLVLAYIHQLILDSQPRYV